MKIGRFTVVALRWPWQGRGWFPHKNGQGRMALLNPTGARFGGGWKYRLGIAVGERSIMIDLIFGTIEVRKS